MATEKITKFTAKELSDVWYTDNDMDNAIVAGLVKKSVSLRLPLVVEKDNNLIVILGAVGAGKQGNETTIVHYLDKNIADAATAGNLKNYILQRFEELLATSQTKEEISKIIQDIEQTYNSPTAGAPTDNVQFIADLRNMLGTDSFNFTDFINKVKERFKSVPEQSSRYIFKNDNVENAVAQLKQDTGSNCPTIKLLFPYRVNNNHWTSIEINISRNEERKVAVNICCHDPKNQYNLNDDEIAQVEKALKGEFGEELNLETKDSAYKARQALSDGSSCGPITVDDIIALAENGKLISYDKPYTPEAVLELRKNQYTSVINSMPYANFPENIKREATEARSDRLTDRTRASTNYSKKALLEVGNLIDNFETATNREATTRKTEIIAASFKLGKVDSLKSACFTSKDTPLKDRVLETAIAEIDTQYKYKNALFKDAEQGIRLLGEGKPLSDEEYQAIYGFIVKLKDYTTTKYQTEKQKTVKDARSNKEKPTQLIAAMKNLDDIYADNIHNISEIQDKLRFDLGQRSINAQEIETRVDITLLQQKDIGLKNEIDAYMAEIRENNRRIANGTLLLSAVVGLVQAAQLLFPVWKGCPDPNSPAINDTSIIVNGNSLAECNKANASFSYATLFISSIAALVSGCYGNQNTFFAKEVENKQNYVEQLNVQKKIKMAENTNRKPEPKINNWVGAVAPNSTPVSR